MSCLPALTPVANDAHAVGDSGERVVAERVEAAALRELLHVGQLALVHPLADEARVHAVEAEDDQLAGDGCAGRGPHAEREADGDGDQRRQEPFHRQGGIIASWNLVIWVIWLSGYCWGLW